MKTRPSLYTSIGLATLAISIGTITETPSRAAGTTPDIFNVGRSKTGQACTAKRNAYSPNATVTFDSATKSFALSCRSATASRTVGWMGIVFNDPANTKILEEGLSCGAAKAVSLPHIGSATARLCNDSRIGSRTVVIGFSKGGLRYLGSSALSLAGPLEQGLAIVSGSLDPASAEQSQVNSSFALESLDSPATDLADGDTTNSFSAENALRIGIRLNQRGLHSDASRTLNDAISRLGSGNASEERGQLELEAALADSNIGFFRIANKHFAQAESLLSVNSDPLVQRKLTTYRALHALNQKQFRQALTYLDTLANDRGATTNPLNDPIQLAILNQPVRQSGKGSISSMAGDDRSALQQRVIDSILDWARSVSLLALNDISGAEVRLNDSRRAFAVIQGSRIDIAQSLWLESRIERQAGRVAARKGDLAGALAAFDKAVSVLKQTGASGASASLSDLAAAQLERAEILTRTNADQGTILAAFEEAVKTVSDAGPGASIDSGAVEGYLDVLSQGTTGSSDAAAAEKFFAAIQVFGEPGIARQIAQLQSIITADPVLGGQFQEYEETGRELSAIGEEIKSKADAPAEERQRLTTRRDSLQKRYNELDTILASNSKLDATRDKQSDLAAVRSKLRDGEVYFKVAPFKRRAYGMAISKDDVVFFRSNAPVLDLVRRATAVRNSIVNINPETGSAPAFKADVAANLYKVLAGPSDRLLNGARSIVVDMTGPLASIPFAVLISDQASVDRYKASRAKSDYSGLEFVVKKSEISNALSPRSFIVSRNQPASSAQYPFLGFGTPAHPDQVRLSSLSPYVTRSGCQADATTIGGSYDQVGDISPDELSVAAQSLGAVNAPFVTGSSFTASSVNNRADISQYAVIHFATHGFREGQWLACSKSPPALLTSLDEGNSDGLLPFDQIASLDLTANLVFLAACNTAAGLSNEETARASGIEETGGSLEGLVRSFLAAKARAVVATHWEVSDEVSLQVVEQFYGRGRTSTIGASLQGAQTSLIANKATSHPFFWAPYFIVGDASKPVLSGGTAVAVAGASN